MLVQMAALVVAFISGTTLAQLNNLPTNAKPSGSKEGAKQSQDKKDKDENKDKEDKHKSESRSLSKSDSKKVDTDKARVAAPLAMGNELETIHAAVETEPVPHGGDAADDPAIWVHPADPSLSTIIGTDKMGGLAVYDLNGKQLQYVADGLMDNVDLRNGFKLGGQKVTLVTAGDRRDNSIAIYKVNPQTRQLENVAAGKVTHGVKVYGACMYQSRLSGKTFYFATSKSGEVEQFELTDNGQGKVDARSVRRFKVGGVVEGCVADDELGHFYVSEEPVGIWKYSAEPEGGTTRVAVGKVGDGHLHADVEGLTIAYGPNGTGYLIASSQGNYSYVVYKREGGNEFVKQFRIGDGAIDGVEETDGIDVTTANLGGQFSKGVFVVQDGFNDKGSKNQNFKLVPFDAIIK
ncbi:MAG: phytase [Acidobacteria bacterium]|nr:phytase [Acidobacteriota bacterium]MBI3422822.1 phytase [Acidobacteriota bacterium]